MMFNMVATKKNFEMTGRTIAGWSRAKGFVPSTVSQLLHGAFPTTGKVGQKIVQELARDGLLVRQEVTQ